jgi:hypothetical protein
VYLIHLHEGVGFKSIPSEDVHVLAEYRSELRALGMKGPRVAVVSCGYSKLQRLILFHLMRSFPCSLLTPKCCQGHLVAYE